MLHNRLSGNCFIQPAHVGMSQEIAAFFVRQAARAHHPPGLHKFPCRGGLEQRVEIGHTPAIDDSEYTAFKRKEAAGGIAEGGGKIGSSVEGSFAGFRNALVQSFEPFLPLNQEVKRRK
jgi:hypothetical protein